MDDWLSNSKDRSILLQIDDRKSDMTAVEFDVPRGSILGPVILHLYVADLQSELQCDCYQYDDDTTFYIHDGRTWINTKILASAYALILTFPALSWFYLFVRPRCE